ncbi:V-type ATPase subunit [bacterium]|nr:V-type ATPase subunit [bacterium]
MVFKPISRYSLVNAKVRARLSSLLPDKLIGRLAETREIGEFYSALSGTVYEGVFSRPEIAIDPRIAEKLLLEKEIVWHSELLKDLKGEVRELVSHFLEKYEIENIKTVLRIRNGTDCDDNLEYITDVKLPNSIPYRELKEAPTMEDALSLLAGTPYITPALAALDDYKEKKALFSIETSLEIDYYNRLKDKVEKLDRRDKQIANRLIGIEIDQKNIGWLMRLKFYYDIPVADLLDYNIPGGHSLNRSKLIKVFQSESIEDSLSVALDQFLGKLSGFFPGNTQGGKLYILEIILWNYLVSEARKALGGFPFTIGTTLAYLILKRAEVRNLITILNGKVLGMNREDIEKQLRVLF